MASSSIHYYPVTLVMRLLQCVLLNCFYNHHVSVITCILLFVYRFLYLNLLLVDTSHSLTAVTMSPHCVWLVIVGGYEKFEWKDVGGGVKQPMESTFITDTNRLIMIIELGK